MDTANLPATPTICTCPMASSSRVPVSTDHSEKNGAPNGEGRKPLGLIPVPSRLLTHRNTWFLKMDTLLAATSLPRCYVILVVGVPTYQELAPILLSGHYANSLVIIATHEPPDTPNFVIPALRILRLSTPLSTEDASAPRFVNILTWAERVARDWRKYGGSSIYELPESTESGPGKRSGPNVSRAGHDTSRRHSISAAPYAYASFAVGTAGSKRSFDVLINLLPSDLPDGVLLRQTIFVTTISRPFLKSSTPGTSFARDMIMKAKSIFGSSAEREQRSYNDTPRTHVEALLTSGTSSLRPLSSTACPQIIHLLPLRSAQYPQASAKLVDSMEAFIAAHASATSMDPTAKDVDPASNIRSFIMHSGTFAKTLDCALVRREETGRKDDPWGCEWTVADVLLSGALDSAPALTKGTTAAVQKPAAWMSGPEDIALVPSSGPPLVQSQDRNTETRKLLYKTVPPLSVPVYAETAAQYPRVPVPPEEEQRPVSRASSYSTSYGHELGSPPPSFHEYQESTRVPGDATTSDAVEEGSANGDHVLVETTAIQEIPKSPVIAPVVADIKDFAGVILPRRVSIKRVQSLVAGWKDVGTWRSRKAKVELA